MSECVRAMIATIQKQMELEKTYIFSVLLLSLHCVPIGNENVGTG